MRHKFLVKIQRRNGIAAPLAELEKEGSQLLILIGRQAIEVILEALGDHAGIVVGLALILGQFVVAVGRIREGKLLGAVRKLAERLAVTVTGGEAADGQRATMVGTHKGRYLALAGMVTHNLQRIFHDQSSPYVERDAAMQTGAFEDGVFYFFG